MTFVMFGLFSFMVSSSFAVTESIQKNRLNPPATLRQKAPGTLIKKPVQPSFPMVVIVSPNVVTPGQKTALTISGSNLSGNMRIKLGQGILAEDLKLMNDIGTLATVQVTVSSDAVPGLRVVNVQYNDQIRPSSARLNVMALYKPPVVRAVSPNTFIQGISYAVMMTGSDLGSLSRVDFGAGITVRKKGPDAGSDNSVSLDVEVSSAAEPGRRMVKITDEKGDHPTSALVIVMAAAPGAVKTEISKTIPGTRVKTEIQPPVGGIIVPKAVPSLSTMLPNRWYVGKKYEIMVYGSRLEENMQLSLGDGIQIQEINVKTASMAQLTIQVDDKAVAGSRFLKYRMNDSQAWTTSGPAGLVISSVRKISKLPAVIKHDAVEDQAYTKGFIDLQTPEFGKFMMMENWESDHGIPTSNDAVVFTWNEKQAGTSQWFELRIIDRNGNILIKRKIEGWPPDTAYAPDVDFIMEIFKLFRPDTVATTVGQVQTITPGPVSTQAAVQKTGPGALFGKISVSSSGTDSGPALSQHEQYIQDHMEEIDCFWQVAGFKTFSSYSIQTGTMVSSNDVEVAISEAWPLKLPQFSPTGLVCSSANTELTPAKVSEEAGEAVDGENFFVGDTLELSGEFTLDGCPWSIGYNTLWHEKVYAAPPSEPESQSSPGTLGELAGQAAAPVSGAAPGGGSGPDTFGKPGSYVGSAKVYGWFFTNVFIDWGDGEWDRVFVWPTSDLSAYLSTIDGADPNDSSQPPQGRVRVAMTHTYRYAQKFPVRMFVLPEDDEGLIESIVAANKAPRGEAVYQSGYHKEPGPFDDRILLASSSVTASDAPKVGLSSGPKPVKAGVSASAASIVSGFESPGSRAFLIYCQPKIVDIKADPAATGALHLIDIAIDTFSGQSADSKGVITIDQLPDSKRKNTRSLPDAKNTATLPLQGLSSTGVTGVIQSGQATVAPQIQERAGIAGNGMLEATFSSDAVASSCDKGLYAQARLEYYGLGRMQLIWKVDGEAIGTTYEDVGPSPVRTEIGQDNQYTQAIQHGFISFTSPNLPLDIGTGTSKVYNLTVEAFVEGYESTPWISAVPETVKIPKPGGGYQNVTLQADEYLKYVARRSPSRTYLVKAPIPGEPCAFKFPVADGRFFTISNIQNRVTKKNGSYSGQGTLYFNIPDGPSGMTTHFADIHIYNWEVSDDGIVTKGQINETGMDIAIDGLPGITGVLKKLKGTVEEPLTAAMDIKIKDSGLHRVGAVTPPEWLNIEADLIPEDGWYAQGQAMPETLIYWSNFRISSNDVCIDLSRLRGGKPKAPAESSAVSGSGQNKSSAKGNSFSESNTSPKSNPPKSNASSKSNTSPKSNASSAASSMAQSTDVSQFSSASDAATPMVAAWAGVNLGETAKLYPFLFGLVEDMDVAARGWCITDSGIEGRTKFNDFSHVMGDGSISFDSIDITAGDQKLDAVYNNITLNIPWPKVSLSGGNATINYTRGQDVSNVELHFNVDNFLVKEEYQHITMTSRIKTLEHMGSGWGIFTDTTFDFTDGRKPFVSVELTDLFFNMFGVAHFRGTGDAAHKRVFSLNQSTTLGDTNFTVHGLNVFAPANKLEPERLAFTFDGQVNFHPDFTANDINVFYNIDKPYGNDPVAKGPSHSDITIYSTFQGKGGPLMHVEVHPEINLPGSTGVTSNDTPDSVLGSLFVSTAHASSGVQDTFRGEVNATMFGDVPLPPGSNITARFRYGTKSNGNVYWLTHVLADGINVPIFSGVNLKAVDGGLAHGFKSDVFLHNPMDADPNGPDSTSYSAGITVGSPDGGIYEMTGQLTLNIQDNVYRMEFYPVRLFGIKLGGGSFEYGNSIFEGEVYGGFNLYKGAIYCDIPQNSGKVGLHFGDDYWSIWAGKPNNEVDLKLLNMATAQGHYQFGTETGTLKYAVGGGITIDTGELCLKIFSGKAYANAGMAMAISPVQLEGHFWIEAGISAYIPCGGKSVASLHQAIRIEASAPPLKMRGEVVIDVPDWWPRVPDDLIFGFDI